MAEEAKPAAVDDAEKSSTVDENEGKSPDGGERTPPEEKDEKGSRTYSEAYVKQLRSENAETRNKVGELEERLQEHENAGKSELEKLTAKLTKETQRADQSEARANRYEVAQQYGLELSASRFLSGSTREEMEAQADELQKLLETKAKQPAAGFDGGARTTAKDPESPEDAHNAFLLGALGKQPARRAP